MQSASGRGPNQRAPPPRQGRWKPSSQEIATKRPLHAAGPLLCCAWFRTLSPEFLLDHVKEPIANVIGIIHFTRAALLEFADESSSEVPDTPIPQYSATSSQPLHISYSCVKPLAKEPGSQPPARTTFRSTHTLRPASPGPPRTSARSILEILANVHDWDEVREPRLHAGILLRVLGGDIPGFVRRC